MEFRFYSIAPRSGIPLSIPLSFFFFFGGFFLIPIPTGLSHYPINGGGCLYAPILGAPLPPFFLLVPIRGAPLPVSFFTASIAKGIPILASKVPRNPPDYVFVGFIWTPEPDSESFASWITNP